MHVEVTKMRRNGVKLQEADMDRPLIGFVRVDYWHLKNGSEDRLVRAIALRSVEDDTSSPMATMNEADCKELRGDYMLWIGEELVPPDRFPQAWLVRPLTDGEKKQLQRRALGIQT